MLLLMALFILHCCHPDTTQASTHGATHAVAHDGTHTLLTYSTVAAHGVIYAATHGAFMLLLSKQTPIMLPLMEPLILVLLPVPRHHPGFHTWRHSYGIAATQDATHASNYGVTHAMIPHIAPLILPHVASLMLHCCHIGATHAVVSLCHS
jgi:hypothetical protein